MQAEVRKFLLPRIFLRKPNPTEPECIDPTKILDDDDFRWMDCPSYEQCLYIAAIGNWISFTCKRCEVCSLRPLFEEAEA